MVKSYILGILQNTLSTEDFPLKQLIGNARLKP